MLHLLPPPGGIAVRHVCSCVFVCSFVNVSCVASLTCVEAEYLEKGWR